MKELSTFWIVGIVFNVTVFTLAFIWLYNIMKKPSDEEKDND